ncbi:hypothetical protein [Streptococcus sp. O1]|nr:hypothetical protein [Streptococcus sp. O1]
MNERIKDMLNDDDSDFLEYQKGLTLVQEVAVLSLCCFGEL